MIDRLLFDKTVLPNGITIYSKPVDVEFAHVRIYVPIGNRNATSEILPGTPHILEHMTVNRSSRFPELDSFDYWVVMNGGYNNALINDRRIKYVLDIPSVDFKTGFEGLFSMAFDPLLLEADLLNEIEVIKSEEKRESRWFPANNELSFHVYTKWKFDYPITLRQIYGEKNDHELLTIDHIRHLHQYYFNSNVYVVIAGNFDFGLVTKELSRLRVGAQDLPIEFRELRWENREYHEVFFPQTQIRRFIYHLGGVFDSSDPQVFMAINFIGKLLTNSANGTLYRWLRNELGWTYNMGFGNSVNYPYPSDWELWLPCNTYEQSMEIRKQLKERIEASISDQATVDQEIKRGLAGEVFWYQTLKKIIDAAERSLSSYGRIYTESEVRELLLKCHDLDFLRRIYERYFTGEAVGEFLAMPES